MNMADYGVTGSSKDVASKLEQSADVLQEKGAKVTGKAAEKIHMAAEKIGNIDIDEYRARMRDMVDSAKSEVDKNVKNVETGIKDHPFESVAIAAGVGLMAGAVIAMMARYSARRYTRT
jgi:ElaB/YqjD/DUF883 family membrane-anchored ribosome-binding protein